MTETQHWPKPSLAQYAAASAICHLRFPRQKELDTAARFEAFARHGVEVVVLLEEGNLQAVSFLLPVTLPTTAGGFRCRFQFQLASRPDKPGAGGLIMREAMRSGAPLIGLGITPEAEKLHAALRWKKIPGIWRGVHPLRATNLIKDYAHRLPKNVPAFVWGLGSQVHDGLSGVAHWTLARGAFATPDPSLLPECNHLQALGSGALAAVKVGNIARILTPLRSSTLQEHAALWRGLQQRGADAVEVLITNEEDRRLAGFRGYLAVPLELWYWDSTSQTADAIASARTLGWSFRYTDKVI